MRSSDRIVETTLDHALSLAPRLRAADLREIEASSGLPPGDALIRAVQLSVMCWTFLDADGVPYAIGGCGQRIPGLGVPWLLASDELPKHRTFFLRNSRPRIEMMHERFPYLYNYVDCRHVESIRWLDWCGFEFTAYEPEWGVQRRPFLRFSSVRFPCVTRSP